MAYGAPPLLTLQQRRWVLAAAAVLLLVGCILYGVGTSHLGLAAAAVKAGAMLAVLGWAAPRWAFVAPWQLSAILLGILIFAVRPGLAWSIGRIAVVGFPVLVLLWLLTRRLTSPRRR